MGKKKFRKGKLVFSNFFPFFQEAVERNFMLNGNLYFHQTNLHNHL